MSEIIQKEIETLKKEVPQLNKLNDEYLFSLVCYKYFYNEGKLSFSDYKEIFTDGRLDGGIDILALYNSPYDYNNAENLLYIQSKYLSSFHNKQEVIDVFHKILQTIKDFRNNNYSSYNDRLKKIYWDSYSNLTSDNNYKNELVLFISLNPTIKKEIDELIIKLEKENKDLDVTLQVYYLSDIENQIKLIQGGRLCVPSGKINIYKEHGRICFSNANGRKGISVNISANSLRQLYEQYKEQGLFEQNYRYFTKMKKIDDGINTSLQKRRNDFWFLNNGIIIACKEFSEDGNNIKLTDFSIINGCQTTSLIGSYCGSNQGVDFAIPCKIIEISINNQEETDADYKFLTEIAQASNSQKPINERDLKANDYKQRELKLALEKKGIYLDIKRGSTKKGRKNIKNELFGQLVLAFQYQQPGYAKSNKREIFSVEKTFEKIFYRKFDIDMIVDLIELYYKFLEYRESYYGDETTIKTSLQESVTKNGMLTVMALIGFIIKEKRRLINLSNVNKDEFFKDEISKDDIQGKLFSDYWYENQEESIELLYSLFNYITHEIPKEYKESEHVSIPNFLKLDSCYRENILDSFITRVYNDRFEKERLNNYTKIFC